MPAILFFIFSVLFLNATNAQTSTSQTTTAQTDAKLNEAVKACLEKKEAASCTLAVPRLHFDKKFALAFKVGEVLCELEPSRCSDIYSLALNYDKKKAEDFSAKIIAECEKNVDYCDSAARLQENQKNYEQALVAAKKYFTKYKKGPYILLAHNHGNKQDAFEASLADCKANSNSCVFYLRYFYEHPQKDEILKNAVADCAAKKTVSDGASNCSILGTYYFKIQEFDLAYKYWSQDCETNNLSCVLILGAKRYNDELTQSTLKKFCSVKTGLVNSLNLQLVECEKMTDETVRVPPAIEKYAVDTLKEFLNEQKLSN